MFRICRAKVGIDIASIVKLIDIIDFMHMLLSIKNCLICYVLIAASISMEGCIHRYTYSNIDSCNQYHNIPTGLKTKIKLITLKAKKPIYFKELKNIT